MEKLALFGGEKTRTRPFPRRTPFGEEEIELVTEAIRSQNLFRWSGRFVSDFERGFAALYGVGHAVAATSGTAAIHLAVGAVNPEPGDEIITAPITDLGSVVPILLQNAVPVFADVDETFNMDPADVERKITSRTRAIIAVHLFGNACDLDALVRVAKKHDLVLIEDCSQAHATRYRDQYLGSIGDIGCFSLQQSKHMTTGDGGMAITDNEVFADRMGLFADKGYRRKGYGPRAYAFLAPCYRMNEQTAAVGLPQLKRVRARVERRMALGRRLAAALADVEGLRCAPTTPGSEHSFWLFPMRVEKWKARDFAVALSAEGVSAGAGYIGKPIFRCAECCASKVTYGESHFPFESRYIEHDVQYDDGTCPEAQQALDRMVTIPFHENYDENDIDDIAAAVHKTARLLPVASS
ncbi:MAG: DegT/DnrJ/EryC1/StrS family aminotransferase [Kiritimatiellaeota bacterium]|nr:DegT/DnrJ/EryC1/StrS family aminotransferase [Kiritimatiellota bacterium]